MVAVAVLHVLEPFQVQCKDLWESLHPQPLSSFLLATALLTIILVFPAEGLVGGKSPEVGGKVYEYFIQIL